MSNGAPKTADKAAGKTAKKGRRFFLPIVLLLLPIVAYYVLFVCFEPNNYFGLRKTALRDDIIVRLREYQRQPEDHIIIGDSRLANFNMEEASQLAGVNFTNLSYGGASLTELTDLLAWAMEKNPQLETVVLGFSFYLANTAYGHDRMIVQSVENPFVYMTNFEVNRDMLETLGISMYNAMQGKPEDDQPVWAADPAIPLGGGENEARDPALDTYSHYPDPCGGEDLYLRDDLYRYAVHSLGERTNNWAFDEEGFARLLKQLEACRENGVQVVVVMPPFDDSVRQLVIEPMQIEQPMLAAVSRLEQVAAVLDYEFTNPPAFTDYEFFDGFHMDYKLGLPRWTQMLFADIAGVLG